jgi:hypothetical protein
MTLVGATCVEALGESVADCATPSLIQYTRSPLGASASDRGAMFPHRAARRCRRG